MNASTNNATTPGLRLHIARTDLQKASLAPDPDSPAARPLAPGEARLHVEDFALTANNLTYAAFGEAMKYWQFFPASDPAFGCLPVWGFATVVESRTEGVAVGQRIYGCQPAGTHLVVQPQRISASGFQDASAHRQELAAVYARYDFCAPRHDAHADGLQAVLQPLFFTSFLIDDFLAENAFFGAGQVLLSSASSKTALGTAWCLAQRKGQPGAPQVLGLTSAAHLAFLQGLGFYDQVLPYEALDTLDPTLPTVYVDMAGNAALRMQVHQRFAGTLAYSCSVGGTHWQALGSGGGLPGPRPMLFFAPAQIKARSAPPPQGWGPGGVQQRIAAAWPRFLEAMQQPAGTGLALVHQRGGPALLAAYAELAAGRASPRAGLMLSLQVGAADGR